MRAIEISPCVNRIRNTVRRFRIQKELKPSFILSDSKQPVQSGKSKIISSENELKSKNAGETIDDEMEDNIVISKFYGIESQKLSNVKHFIDFFL